MLRVFTVSHLGVNQEHPYQNAMVVAVMTKDGLSHEIYHVMGGNPEDNFLFTEESQVHVTSEGVIWMLTRAHGTGGDLWQAVSFNNGRSWTAAPSSITLGRSPASGLVQLDDGRLLLVAGYRLPPHGIRAFISDDEGLTWSPDLILRDDGGGRDIGYARALQLEDGTVITIYWYHAKDDVIDGVRQNVHIACTRFRVTELID